MPKYAVITSDVPENVLKYLKKAGVDFKTYDFNTVLNLSDIEHQDINNGWMCWENCDNFICGLEWEDYGIKPKNPEEAQRGNLSESSACNRGWTKFRCKSAETEDNPKGIKDFCSWIRCNHCEHYQPKTLEGRRDVLVAIRGQYDKVLDGLAREIESVQAELKKQTETRTQ